MSRKSILIGGLVVIGLAVVLVLLRSPELWPGSRESAAVRLAWDDPAVVDRGAGIYAEHCAACHGDNLEGQPDWRQRLPDGRLPAPPHDPEGHTWHHPDAQLFLLTKLGPAAVVGDPDYRTDMPGFEGVLTDSEILAVLSYIKSTWPEAIRARHDAINRRAGGG